MKVLRLFLLFAYSLLPLIANAQPGQGDGGNKYPITNGIVFLLLGALGYGLKSLKQRKIDNKK